MRPSRRYAYRYYFTRDGYSLSDGYNDLELMRNRLLELLKSGETINRVRIVETGEVIEIKKQTRDCIDAVMKKLEESA
jgi:hypothetical protein